MLKASPDGSNRRSERLSALVSGAHVTRFVGQAGSLNSHHASQAAGFATMTIAGARSSAGGSGCRLAVELGLGLRHHAPGDGLVPRILGLALVHPGKDSRFAFAVGLAVAVVAALDLSQILFNVEPAIDRWLVPRAPVPQPGAASFRVANATVLAFGLAGGSLALGSCERCRLAATVLGGIAGAIAVFALLGYLIVSTRLYGPASITRLHCDRCRPPLRYWRDHPADRNDARAPQAAAVVAFAGHAGMRNRAPLLLLGVYAGIRIADAQLDQGPGEPDEWGTYSVGRMLTVRSSARLKH